MSNERGTVSNERRTVSNEHLGIRFCDKPLEKSLETLFFQKCQDPTSQSVFPNKRAWDRFREIGLPTTKSHAYGYVPVRKLATQEFVTPPETAVTPEHLAPFILPETKNSYLVFINGQFSPTLSCTDAIGKQLVIAPLSKAIKTYGTLLAHRWNEAIKEETDPFVLLNAALHQDGVFLYLPPGYHQETPIQLLHFIHLKEGSFLIAPKVSVFAGKGSEITLVSSLGTHSGNGFFYNVTTEFSLDEGAKVDYVQESLSLPSQAWHFDATRAQLKRDAIFNAISMTKGSILTRRDYKISLIGENAEATLKGLSQLSEKREAHINVLMSHLAPHCRSFQLFKSIVNDVSRSSFEGKILVDSIAQKTEAFQRNCSLLLNDYAQVFSKPNLEIFADDVKASHGATVGQLDQEQVFYLLSRGFTKPEAEKLLISGFAGEILQVLPIASLREPFTTD